MPWRACEHESSDERHRACPSCIGPARAKGSRCGPQRSGLGRTWRAPTRFAHGKEGSFAKGARTRAGARPSRRLQVRAVIVWRTHVFGASCCTARGTGGR